MLSDFVSGQIFTAADVTADAAEPELLVHKSGPLTAPGGLALDAGETILVAETGAHRVAVSEAADSWQWYGSRGSGPGELERPADVAFRRGALLVLDSGNCRLAQVDDLGGQGWQTYGHRGRPTPGDPAVGSFADPRALAVDTADRIWVSDPGAGRVTRVDDLSGQGWRECQLPPGDRPSVPYGIAPYAAGVVVVDAANRRLVALDADGAADELLDLRDCRSPAFVGTAGDRLLVADVGANELRCYTPTSSGFDLTSRLRGSPPDRVHPFFSSIGGVGR